MESDCAGDYYNRHTNDTAFRTYTLAPTIFALANVLESLLLDRFEKATIAEAIAEVLSNYVLRCKLTNDATT